jgi:hypothetical protein
MNSIKLSKKSGAKLAASVPIASVPIASVPIASVPIMSTPVVKIVRESFSKPLIDIINLDAFDNEAERGVLSAKEYQVPINQRFPRWDQKSWGKLVDSIMNDLPMSSLLMTQSMIKINEDQHCVNLIQDGQTRLSLLQAYIKNEYTWNDKFYKDLTEFERSRFNTYNVRVELIKKKSSCSDAEFKNICRTIFERINSGKPLTDNDKFHNCMDEPVLQFIMKELKSHPELYAPLKKIFGDIGGGKSRTGLANIVGCVIALSTGNIDCITPSYTNNSQYVISDNGTSLKITDLNKERVIDFFRWYIGLVNEFKEKIKINRTPGFLKKISGVLALTLTDWSDGLAVGRREMWIDLMVKINEDKMCESRIYKTLEKGVTANNSAVNFRKRIQCISSAYEKRLYTAETNVNDDNDDDEYSTSSEENHEDDEEE